MSTEEQPVIVDETAASAEINPKIKEEIGVMQNKIISNIIN